MSSAPACSASSDLPLASPTVSAVHLAGEEGLARPFARLTACCRRRGPALAPHLANAWPHQQHLARHSCCSGPARYQDTARRDTESSCWPWSSDSEPSERVMHAGSRGSSLCTEADGACPSAFSQVLPSRPAKFRESLPHAPQTGPHKPAAVPAGPA